MEVLTYLLSLTILVVIIATGLEKLVSEEYETNVNMAQSGIVPIKVLWEDDFSGDWENRWSIVYLDPGSSYTFEYRGKTWLRVIYREGQVREGFHLKTQIKPQDRIYLEYKLRFGENFDWVKGGKLPGVYGGKTFAAKVPNGRDGWSIRVMWRSDGMGSVYVYHPDQARQWADHFRLDSFRFQKGVVQTLGMEVVMNTPGEHDGIIRAWLDGVLVVEETGIRFRDIPGLQIDGLIFDTIFGGRTDDWAPKKNEIIDFGNFKIYEAPPWRGNYKLTP